MFLGLRTVVYPAPDLAASTAWFTELLGIEPYFDEPFYVGFEVAGYELGLLPTPADPPPGSAAPDHPTTRPAVAYWGVGDADVALAELVAAGATVVGPVTAVGEGIRTAEVLEPGGSVMGIIENPHFRLPATPPPSDGPGR